MHRRLPYRCLASLVCATSAAALLAETPQVRAQAPFAAAPAAETPFLLGCDWPVNGSQAVKDLFYETGCNFARITGGGYAWAADSHKEALRQLNAHGVKALLQLGSHYPSADYFALTDSYFVDQAGQSGAPDRNVWAVVYSGQAWPQYSYASLPFRDELTKDFTAYISAIQPAPNVAGVLLHNEPGYFWLDDREFDYNPQSLTRFRHWLVAQHGTIQTLNQRWGTTYSSFADVDPPKDLPPVRNEAAWLDWRRFNAALIQDFLQWEATFAGQVMPGVPRSTNLSGPLDDWYPIHLGDNYRYSAPMDVASIDIYPSPGFTRFFPGYAVDMTAGVAQGRPVWVPECEVYDGSRFPGLSEEQRADMLRSELWGFIGHGANGVLMWSLSGQGGFHLTDGEFNARVGAVREIAHEAKLLHLGAFRRPARTVAVCIDQDSFVYEGGLKPKREGSWLASADAQGIYAAVAERQLPVDVISADQVRQGLGKRYRAILLAAPVLMDTALAAQLRAFVAGGGLLIAEAPFAERGHWGGTLPRAPGFGLDHVFGVRFAPGGLQGSDGVVIATPNGNVPGMGRVTVTPAGATVIGTFSGGAGGAAATMNRYGKGTGIFLASQVGVPNADRPTAGADAPLASFVGAALARYAGILPPVTVRQDSNGAAATFLDVSTLQDGRGNRLIVLVSPSDHAKAVAPATGVHVDLGAIPPAAQAFAFEPARRIGSRLVAGPHRLAIQRGGPSGSPSVTLAAVSPTTAVLLARDSPPLVSIDAPLTAQEGVAISVHVTVYNPSERPLQGTPALVLPAGWRMASDSQSIGVAPRGSSDVVFRVLPGRISPRAVVTAAFVPAGDAASAGAGPILGVPVDVMPAAPAAY